MAKTPPPLKLGDIDPKMITNPKVRQQIEAEKAKSGGSTIGEGLKSAVKNLGASLSDTLPKTLTESFGSSAEDAKETGKRSPPTGDVSKDIINAVRDLQSDVNTQTGVLRQTNGILISQSKLMADGFGNLANQISKIKNIGGGGGPIPFDLFDPTTWFNRGGGKGGGETISSEKTKLKPEERYKFNEKANRWMDTEKGVGGGNFMSNAEAEAKGLGKGGTRTPVSEGFWTGAKKSISSGIETVTSGVKTLTKTGTKIASKAAIPLLAAAACWDAYIRIKNLNPADPDFKKKVTQEIAGLIAEFGVSTVGAIFGGIAAGAISGPGAIVGFLGGLAGGALADYYFGDSADAIAKQLIEFLWPSGAAPVKPNKLSMKGKAAAAKIAAPEMSPLQIGMDNAKNAEFDIDTGKRLTKAEIDQRNTASLRGAPIYDAMGNFTGDYEEPVDKSPTLQQKEASRNKLQDKGGIKVENIQPEIPESATPFILNGKTVGYTAAGIGIVAFKGHEEEIKQFQIKSIVQNTGKTPAMAELAQKEQQAKTELKTQQFQQQLITSTTTGAIGLGETAANLPSISGTKLPASTATSTSPAMAKRPSLPAIPTAPKSPIMPHAAATSPISPGAVVGGAVQRKEERDRQIGYEKASGTAMEAMQFFTAKGWTKEQAAGIVGNLKIESGNFSSEVISGRRRGDNGKAVGVAQWHPDRQARFKYLFGKDITGSTFKEQLEFVNWELNNTEKNAGAMLGQARNAAEAAAIFDKFYERSSGTARSQRMMAAQNYAGEKIQTASLVEASGAGAGFGGSNGLGTALKSKETAALSTAMGQTQSTAAVSSAAATRDSVGMTPPAVSPASTTPNNVISRSTSPTGGQERPSNKVEAALPSSKIFHELFGIGAGGKGSTSFTG